MAQRSATVPEQWQYEEESIAATSRRAASAATTTATPPSSAVAKWCFPWWCKHWSYADDAVSVARSCVPAGGHEHYAGTNAAKSRNDETASDGHATTKAATTTAAATTTTTAAAAAAATTTATESRPAASPSAAIELSTDEDHGSAGCAFIGLQYH